MNPTTLVGFVFLLRKHPHIHTHNPTPLPPQKIFEFYFSSIYGGFRAKHKKKVKIFACKETNAVYLR